MQKGAIFVQKIVNFGPKTFNLGLKRVLWASKNSNFLAEYSEFWPEKSEFRPKRDKFNFSIFFIYFWNSLSLPSGLQIYFINPCPPAPEQADMSLWSKFAGCSIEVNFEKKIFFFVICNI